LLFCKYYREGIFNEFSIQKFKEAEFLLEQTPSLRFICLFANIIDKRVLMSSIANNLQLKVSDLANGIYFIVGKNKTTNINQKIIVNK